MLYSSLSSGKFVEHRQTERATLLEHNGRESVKYCLNYQKGWQVVHSGSPINLTYLLSTDCG